MQTSQQKSTDIIQKETRTAALFLYTIAQHMNIQFTDIRCLNYLMNNTLATAGDIATETGLTTGAVTAMIDRLEKTGFIKRQSDADDRRKTIITLKNNNFRKSNVANIFFANDVKNLLSTFSKDEQITIIKWNIEMTKLLQSKTKNLNTKNT